MVIGSARSVVGSHTARSSLVELQDLRQQIELERRFHNETWGEQYAIAEQIQACRSDLLHERGEQQHLRAQLELSERTELSHAGAASSLYSQIEEERNFVRRELAAIAAQEVQSVQDLRTELHAAELAVAAKQEAEAPVATAALLGQLNAECHQWDVEIVALGEALREVQLSTMQEAGEAADIRDAQGQLNVEASELHAGWSQLTAGFTPSSVGRCPDGVDADQLEAIQRQQDLQAELAALEQELESRRLQQRFQAEQLETQVQQLASELESSNCSCKQRIDNVLKLEAQAVRLQEEQSKLRALLDSTCRGRSVAKSVPLLPRVEVPSIEQLCQGLKHAEDHRSRPRRRAELSPFIKRKLMQHDLQLHKFLNELLPKALPADKDEMESPRQFQATS